MQSKNNAAACQYISNFDPNALIRLNEVSRAFEAGADWKEQVLNSKVRVLTESLQQMKKLNLHLYEPGTIGNECYLVMTEALSKV